MIRTIYEYSRTLPVGSESASHRRDKAQLKQLMQPSEPLSLLARATPEKLPCWNVETL